MAHDDQECLATIRELLSFLPSNNLDDAPCRPTQDDPTCADDRPRHHHPGRIHTSPTEDMVEVITRIGRPTATSFPGPRALRPATSSRRLRPHERPDPVGIVAPTSPPSSPASSTSTPAIKGALASSASATPSTSRSSTFARTSPASCPASSRSDGGDRSAVTGPSSFTHAFAEGHPSPSSPLITRKAYGRSLLRHELEAPPHRLERRLAHRRNRRHGPEGAVNIVYKRELDAVVRRAEAVVPQGVSLTEEQKLEVALRSPQRKSRRVPRALRQSLRCSRTRLHRCSHPPQRNPPPSKLGAQHARHQARQESSEEAWQHPAIAKQFVVRRNTRPQLKHPKLDI